VVKKRSHQSRENVIAAKSIFSTSRFYKGWYVTPIGCFYSSEEAGKALGCDGQIIIKRCIKANNNVIKSTKSCILDVDDRVLMIGQTWKELGWGFYEWSVEANEQS